MIEAFVLNNLCLALQVFANEPGFLLLRAQMNFATAFAS